MKIIVKQRDLQNSISTVQKAVADKTTISSLKGILFTAEDNKLKLTANNLVISIEVVLDADVLKPGQITFYGNIIESVVKNIKEEYIAIEVDKDTLIATIKYSNTKIEIHGFDSEDILKFGDFKEYKFIMIRENILKKLIKQTLYVVSEVKPGEFIELDNGSIIMYAISGERLALRKSYYEGYLNERIRDILPKQSLIVLESLLSKEGDSLVEIISSENKMVFKIGKTRFLTVTMELGFIEYNYILSSKIIAKITVGRQELINALELTNVFFPYQSRGVKFRAAENKLTLSINSEEGNVIKTLDVDYSGKEIVIAFNARYFLEPLKTLNEEFINLIIYYDGLHEHGGLQLIDSDEYEYFTASINLF